MRFRGSTIFVTGGAGFIGSAVVRHLLARQPCAGRQHRQADLCGQSRFASRRGRQSALCLRADLHLRGRTAAQSVRQVPARRRDEPRGREPCRSLDRRPRRIHPDQHCRHLHAAAGSAAPLAKAAGREARAVSLPARLDRRGVRLARRPTARSSETTAYAPNSPYSASKASSDHLVRAWRETYELPTLVTNCSNNYGPYHFPEKLIPHMIIKGLAGEPMPVYGDGQNVRDWLYVEDHARALSLVLERGAVGETYNVGGRNERTNLHVVETICDLLDRIVARRRRAAPTADQLRHRPSRPRPALCHRRLEARARAGLAGRREFRKRHRKDGAVVCRAANHGGRRSLAAAMTRERLGLIQTPTSQPSREPAT